MKKKNKYFLNNLNDIKNKYKILFQNVINIMNEENYLLNDNIIFKKFYNSQQTIRIADITCPEVIINEEYLDDNGLFAFSIESKSPENIIYTLSNNFYIDLKSKNLSVKKNQDRLLTEKMSLMVQRLLIIRNSMINSFFDSKSRNEVGASVIRDLEHMILKQLQKKRLLIKKDEKITKENLNIENKEKNYLSNNNLNLNLKGNNNHLDKNKNKFFLETNSFLEDNSYSKKNNKNKKLYLGLFQDFENNIKIKNNKIRNKKMKSLKFLKNNNTIKFSNHLLNMHKKKYSSSLENTLNITNKDLNAINQLPFKDNEEDILFSLYDDIIDDNTSLNISYKLQNSNYNISRNLKNQFTQINKKVDKPIFNSFGYKSEDQKNNFIFPPTREIFMNNLIWENIKSVIKYPIKQKLNLINYNKTFSNFYKNKKAKNKNIQSFLENNSKYITNRNINKNKITQNCKTEENKFIKSYQTVNNNNKLTKHFSFNKIKLGKFNKIYILSSPYKLKNTFLSNIKTNEKKINNTEYINKDIKKQNILNLKKVNKSIDSVNFKTRLKKFYSPHQINFMRMNQKMRQVMDINKYNIIKEEKFKNYRNDYYKKNIVKRMNHFYGAAPD